MEVIKKIFHSKQISLPIQARIILAAERLLCRIIQNKVNEWKNKKMHIGNALIIALNFIVYIWLF